MEEIGQRRIKSYPHRTHRGAGRKDNSRQGGLT